MRHHFSDHARERAQERYGRDFTADELNDIFHACMDGRAFCGRISEDGTTAYRLTLEDGFIVIPVIARQKTFIITFLPSDFFTAGHALRSAKAGGLVKQCFAAARHARRPYRRERITIQQALEAE